MINLTFNYPAPPCYSSSDEAANYFNSLVPPFQYHYVEPLPIFYHQVPYQFGFYPPQLPLLKSDPEAERSTADCQEYQEEAHEQEPAVIKQEETSRSEEEFIPQERKSQSKVSKCPKAKVSKAKKEISSASLRKNTESNIINNIFSYVSCEMKSHKAITKVLKTKEKKKIFYTFMGNLKKLNNKYVNRKNVSALLDLTPDEPQERTLSKSVKRLLILPINELRVILRRLVYDYLKGEISLVPILTSKKIGRLALKEHMEKRRELLEYFFKKSESS